MIPQTVWETLARDIPTAVILLIGIWAVAKYLDKWLGRFAATNEVGSERRQKEIMVLLERLVTANAETDKKLTGVVERNTAAMDRLSESALKQAQALAALVQADTTQAQTLRDMNASLVEHYKEVASRPCQMVDPSRKRPATPRSGGSE